MEQQQLIGQIEKFISLEDQMQEILEAMRWEINGNLERSYSNSTKYAQWKADLESSPATGNELFQEESPNELYEVEER